MKLDLTNRNHQMILGALASMVEDDGLTPHEVFEVLDDMQRQTWHALAEIYRERGKKNDGIAD